MKPDEESLIEKIVYKSDKKAFECLFFDYYDYLYRFAYRYLRHKEEAEELVSDIFLTLWRKRASLLSIQNLKVYLHVMVKHQAINYIKKHRKISFLSINDIPVDFTDQAETPEARLLTKELIKEIEAAIDELPARCKVVFQLVRIDGLRYREVAEILNISVKTVENQVGIAIQKIGSKLAHHLQNQKSHRFLKWGSGALVLAGLIFLFV